MTDLVPNRECGPCRACCEAPLIDDPQLTKLPGVLCPNYRHGLGCSIYETRPSTCRAWYCGWRRLENLGEEWRPDRSKIMIVPISLANPVRLEDGLQFDLIGGLEALTWEPFVTALSLLIESDFPVWVAVPRGVGFQPLSAHLNMNPMIKAGIANSDFAAITAALRMAVQACLDSPKVEVVFKNL